LINKLLLKKSISHKVIFASLAVLCFVLSETGCNRKRSDASDPSIKQGDATSNSQANARIDVPAQGDAQSYVNQGDQYLKNDQDKEALESFTRAIELDKDFAEGYLKLGLAYDALNKDEEADKAYKSAIEAFEKKIKSEPENGRAHYGLGQAYYRLGRYEDAARAFRQATRFEPENSDAHYELGMAHFKQARYDVAIGALKKAIELDPDNFRAVEALEKAEDGKNRIAEMVKHQAAELKKQKEKDANANASPGAKPSPK
jgi:tetratricopeptide (TPR) repeat protein